jgi:hypothetical protein
MIPLTPWEGIIMNVELTGKVFTPNDVLYWRIGVGDLIAYVVAGIHMDFYVVVNDNIEINNAKPNLVELDQNLIHSIRNYFQNKLWIRKMTLDNRHYLEFVGLNLKGTKVTKVGGVFIEAGHTPQTFKEAISRLEELGNFAPSLSSILAIMGKEVEFLPWYDIDKNVRDLKPLTFNHNDSKNNPPLVGECFEESYGFKLISSSEKRMIFSNGKYYIVDTPYYGHALYIFSNVAHAQEWAENKISAETAMKKAIRRIIHVEGTWTNTLAVALQQLR